MIETGYGPEILTIRQIRGTTSPNFNVKKVVELFRQHGVGKSQGNTLIVLSSDFISAVCTEDKIPQEAVQYYNDFKLTMLIDDV